MASNTQTSIVQLSQFIRIETLEISGPNDFAAVVLDLSLEGVVLALDLGVGFEHPLQFSLQCGYLLLDFGVVFLQFRLKQTLFLFVLFEELLDLVLLSF